MVKITEHQIESFKSKRGGWNKKSLAHLGVPWPPPKGWKKALMNGEPIVAVQHTKARKLIPMADVVAAYGTSPGHGSRTFTCRANTCTYPTCQCAPSP